MKIRRVSVASGLVAVAVLAGCGGGRGEITVPAERTWTDTGLRVETGKGLEITARGKVQAGPDLSCGPGGFADRPEWKVYSVIADAPHIGVIGRIGIDGPPFYVGVRYEGTADRSGLLFLGVNDTDAANNLGSFTATVTVR